LDDVVGPDSRFFGVKSVGRGYLLLNIIFLFLPENAKPFVYFSTSFAGNDALQPVLCDLKK